jgi:predicted transcriptional regulator
MKLNVIITTMSIFACILTNAQQVEVQVVYNNTADINSNLETINRIKSAVKTTELQTALNSNNHITDKNLIIRVAFFDRGVIGQLKLKTEHELTPEKYIEKWQDLVTNKSGILFLFVKGKGGTDYTFYKMVASSQLEDEHLFPKVTEFINENLSGDFTTIVGNGTKYLAKAITPVWTDAKKASAEMLISTNSKYDVNHINLFHNWFGFSFFDLKPATANQTKDMKLVNCMTKKDGGDWFFSNKYIYTSGDNLIGYNTNKFYDWNITFEEDDVKGIYVFYDQFLYNILTTIENSGKHNSSQKASAWNWTNESKYKRSLSDYTGFSNRSENDRLILYFDDSYKNKEGQEISILCQSYGSTWCNVFACDLANEVLFGNIFGDIHNGPWGSHGSASQIHDKIDSSKQFKSLGFDDAWKYTNSGYVVYLTAYNWQYYVGLTTNAHAYSGHIATCYPTDNYQHYLTANIIQAGAKIGIMQLQNIWSDPRNIKANVYLGYILK